MGFGGFPGEAYPPAMAPLCVVVPNLQTGVPLLASDLLPPSYCICRDVVMPGLIPDSGGESARPYLLSQFPRLVVCPTYVRISREVLAAVFHLEPVHPGNPASSMP